MNSLTTKEQAKQIIGGRTPLLPVEYETACKALAACATIDEAKYWDNKADALAAWAKIYRSKSAETQAKRLKLHAYRRMGILARELEAETINRRRDDPGAKSILIGSGLNCTQAVFAGRIAKIDEREFLSFVNRPNPPSPRSLTQVEIADNPNWSKCKRILQSARATCRQLDAAELGGSISLAECSSARELVNDLSEWLDKLEANLGRRLR